MRPSRSLLVSLVVAVVIPVAAVGCRSSEPAPIGREPSSQDASIGARRHADPGPTSPQPDQPGTMSAPSCEALLRRTEAIFAQSAAGADAPCRADADCEQVRATCRPTCGGLAIARANEARHRDETASPEAECALFARSDCAITLALPMPSCPVYQAVCRAGHCRDEIKTR